jgi:hypothetical protein
MAMKIEQINLTYVVHSLATLTLLGTVALFGYEVSKPKIVAAESSSVVWKLSHLSPELAAKEQIHHLPALPERFQRKVLVYAVRYKRPQPGKIFTPTGKTYLAMTRQHPAED